MCVELVRDTWEIEVLMVNGNDNNATNTNFLGKSTVLGLYTVDDVTPTEQARNFAPGNFEVSKVSQKFKTKIILTFYYFEQLLLF